MCFQFAVGGIKTPSCARFFVGEAEQLLYAPKQSTDYWPPLSVLPWQCCTVIDKVDKEMLRHAPDRLDLKSMGCRTAAARQHTLSPPTISSSQKMSGSSVGTGTNVIFGRFVCFGLSCCFETSLRWVQKLSAEKLKLFFKQLKQD